MKDLECFETLVAIMDRLRGPDGCPWDREQDYRTLRGYLLEECHEVADALDREHAAGLCEELGDLLFQIVFLSRIAEEDGSFTARDVIRGISEKMIRRHPHVFGSETAETAEEVLVNWERIKRSEKAGAESEHSVLDGVPLALSSLIRAQRLGTKAAHVGFDWERPGDILDKVEEELGELRQALEAGSESATREELGDVLFALAQLARRGGLDAEGALASANLKFQRRFGWIEGELAHRGTAFGEADMELLEELWGRAKKRERSDQST